MKPYLGMYVHMHWGYNHPYAARTWTLDDWRNYASGIKSLGYNMMMIWPMLETIPDPPTPSDVAHLEKIGRVIDMLHSELDMHAIIVVGPNVVGNEMAAEYAFENRPYFKSDLRLNPADPDDVARLINFRRKLFKYLHNMDGCAIIDSDPGGYIGSTNAEFANLIELHQDMLTELNPSARVYYWMWVGWEAYNKMWQDMQEGGHSLQLEVTPNDFDTVIAQLMKHPEKNWAVYSCWEVHQQIVEKYGIEDRALYYPYGIIEGEPTFPITNYTPEAVLKECRRYDPAHMQLGAMANGQSHVHQLPHTYIFSHFINGDSIEDIDLVGFGEKLIPGKGELLARSWTTLAGGDPTEMRCVANEIAENMSDLPGRDKCSSLLLLSPQDYLEDIALQLAFRADAIDFISATESGADARPHLKPLVTSWTAWQQRTGFVDAYCDPFGLLPAVQALHNPAVDKVIDEFDNWTDPTLRHGTLVRLLDVLRSIA